MKCQNLTLSESAYGKIVGVMKTNYQIGDTAYIVDYCPEPTNEQADADNFDCAWWQLDHTEEEVFPSLVKAIAFARKAAKTSIFGVVEVYEAVLSNPYKGEFPDWMVKQSALRWQKLEGGYECEINR